MHRGLTPDFSARLIGPRPGLDPRRYIARPDLVDIALAAEVSAARYVAPLPMVCAVTRTPMRKTGAASAIAVSELLFGENFDVFETVGDWAFGRSVADMYTGWVLVKALAEPAVPPIVRVTARIAPVFSAADIKSPVIAELPFGAQLSGVSGAGFMALHDGGHVHNRHFSPLAPEPLAIARIFSGAPYSWGGRTPDGVDCSGLVQAVLAACGIAAPRDSDQQLAELGTAVAFEEREAGDLMFFPGHVGLLAARDTLFHANAHWMATVEEPLGNVIARLKAAGLVQPVMGLRRVRLPSCEKRAGA